jgi:hypothetical protein
MGKKINLGFNNEYNITVDLYDNPTVETFLKIHKKLRNFPDRINNRVGVNLQTFSQDCRRAKEILGFNWDLELCNQDNYNRMHKDLERVYMETGFVGFSKEIVDLLTDIHNNLHVIESQVDPQKGETERFDIQMTWVRNNMRKPFPEKVKFSRTLNYGDVYLVYPHVGKDPLTCLYNNDNDILSMTCKIHNMIGKDFRISLRKPPQKPWTPGMNIENYDVALTEWYYKHHNQTASLFTLDEVLDTCGWCIIGHVDQYEELDRLRKTGMLICTKFELPGTDAR